MKNRVGLGVLRGDGPPCPSSPTVRPVRSPRRHRSSFVWPERLWSNDQAASRLHHRRSASRLPKLVGAPNRFRVAADRVVAPDQLARLWVAPALDLRLPDFFASSASQASMVEGSFATSGQGRPSESTAMWLSGPTGMQPGMTPRLRVITRFFIALLPADKKRRRMAGQGEHA